MSALLSYHDLQCIVLPMCILHITLYNIMQSRDPFPFPVITENCYLLYMQWEVFQILVKQFCLIIIGVNNIKFQGKAPVCEQIAICTSADPLNSNCFFIDSYMLATRLCCYCIHSCVDWNCDTILDLDNGWNECKIFIWGEIHARNFCLHSSLIIFVYFLNHFIDNNG